MTSQITVPKSSRLQIGVFGRRNVGKSSILNALMRQSLAIVSDVAGTTTDPLEKALELQPLGAVLVVDAAGVDDDGGLGIERVAKTRQAFDRADLFLTVVDTTLGDGAFGTYEESLIEEARKRDTPTLVVLNKTDAADEAILQNLEARLRARNLATVRFSAKRDFEAKTGAPELRDALIKLAPESFLTPPPIIADLLAPGELALLVTPIDKEAPKGRLILPQVQTIRDLLDGDCGCVVVKENLLATVLGRMNPPPALVVTDSQVFKTVATLVPETIPLTSFSILFARQKGDLKTLVAGARAIDKLKPTSRVLIAEACSHHPIEEDIGTVKIPRLLRKKFGETLEIEHVQGRDFPDVDSMKDFDLAIHCGGCMFNRREMLSRIQRAEDAGTPMTNYGLAIASLNGILERAVKPLGL